MRLSRRGLLRSLASLPLLLVASYAWPLMRAPAPVVELHIATDGDFLAFTPDQLKCPTGAHVRLVFHHAGKRVTQQHNWVLVLPGAASAVEQEAVQAGDKHGWLPHGDPRILAATRMCNPGETVTAEFIAPAPGDYPFICTYPGHGAEMRGVLHVTPRN
ncbi:MAG TPA: plastocyanin/azurin family copper-binding protein [Steroidobacteraceae bacterium]|nr:plastocyanin/azurin family copper-binding protein [Steroidobacteraceae bacterium]